MKKAAIFDVDGTLLDSMPIWDDACEKYLRGIGVIPEPNLGEILFPMSVRQGANYVVERYNLSKTPEEVIEGTKFQVNHFYYYEAKTKPGVMELLKYLDERGIPMAVATSSQSDFVGAALRRLKIDRYFKKIFTCDDLETSKREPFIYEEAARLLGAKKENVYVFEDALYAIETAKRAGFITVGVYDNSSKQDWERIKKEASSFVVSLDEFRLE